MSAEDRRKVGLPKSIDDGKSAQTFLRPVKLHVPPTPTFTVLGIETSCDDTGVAIVRSDGTILGEALASQAALHEEWGGVVPGLARDAHAEALDRVVTEALKNANMSSVAEVDAVGVTVGPGLEICLRVGTEGAKALALKHNKPFVGVHHLEAHVLMARLAAGIDSVPFPFLTLLTSGGHCQLLLTKGIGQHTVLGSTLDDALGEAFDKVARLLELPVGGGGGPALEKLAKSGNKTGIRLPIPMQNKKSLDFSFAGLKTAVRVAVQKASEEVKGTEAFQADVAASFQHSAFSHLEQRLKYAFQFCEQLSEDDGGEEDEKAKAAAPNTLVVSGGVAANQELRRRLQELCEKTAAPGEAYDGESWKLVVPPPRLCTDNGVMVAWAAIEAMREGVAHEAEGQEVRARWPLGRLAQSIAPPNPQDKGAKRRAAMRKGLEVSA